MKNQKICGKSENSQKKMETQHIQNEKIQLGLAIYRLYRLDSFEKPFFISVVENGLKTINSVLRNNTSKIIQLNSKILADYNGLARQFHIFRAKQK